VLLVIVIVIVQVTFGWLDSYGEVGGRSGMLGGHVLLHVDLVWPTIDTLPTSGWAGQQQLQEVRCGLGTKCVSPVAVLVVGCCIKAGALSVCQVLWMGRAAAATGGEEGTWCGVCPLLLCSLWRVASSYVY
jgi:hypothetical protein